MVYRKSLFKSGQILVVVLIIMVVVSLLVISISSAVIRNSQQVSNNAQYLRAYNTAETRLLSLIDFFASSDFQIIGANNLDLEESISTTINLPVSDIDCVIDTTSSFFCGINEASDTRTIIKASETNFVENYTLKPGDYFGLALNDYRAQLSFDWVGNTAFELTLQYSDLGSGIISQQIEIVDSISPPFVVGPNKAVAGAGSHGFLVNKPTVSNNSFEINLGSLQNVPNNSRLERLNVKSVTRDVGTSISIRPLNSTNLPNQVRNIEAFAYESTSIDSASPIVQTQIPLYPQLPGPLVDGINFAGVMSIQCSDNILQGAEECDDGNNSNNDTCLNTCRLNTCGDGFEYFGVEECDLGSANSLNGDCTPSCVLPRCGDGLLWNQGSGTETCDPAIGPPLSRPGHAPNCRGVNLPGACTYCGDGRVDALAGETCDEGALNGQVGRCNNTCSGTVPQPDPGPGPGPGGGCTQGRTCWNGQDSGNPFNFSGGCQQADIKSFGTCAPGETCCGAAFPISVSCCV